MVSGLRSCPIKPLALTSIEPELGAIYTFPGTGIPATCRSGSDNVKRSLDYFELSKVLTI